MATHHLSVLDDLARGLKEVTLNGLLNARRLAQGYDDLVVVLIEPTDQAEQFSYEDMLAASPTLLSVNETLKFASCGERNIENTIILDIRAFRSNSIRTSQAPEDRLRDDELAYRSFGRILSILRPRVAIICQCATSEAEIEFVRCLSSSIEKAGELFLHKLPNDHECLFVKSFHPMYYGRSTEHTLRRDARKYLLDFTFIVALNALVGKRIVGGMGIVNLRRSAQDNAWISEKRIARGGLLKRFQSSRKFQSILHAHDAVTRILAMYKETAQFS